MKVPQIPAMPGMAPLGFKRPQPSDASCSECGDYLGSFPLHCDRCGRRRAAQRKADAPMLAPKPQQPCDVGLFSDDARQTDLTDFLK
jgi:hypothetical protein